MSDNELLSRIRKLNWLLSQSTVGYVSFDELCRVLAEILDSNVYVLSRRGKVLASVCETGSGSPIIETEKISLMPKKQNKNLLKLADAIVNVTGDEAKKLFGDEYEDASKFHIIEPVSNCGNRIATLIVARPDEEYSEEDTVTCELGATIVGMEVAKGLAEEEKEDLRGREVVRMAIDNLSYSEMAALQKVFDEFDGDEILFVASKVADKYGITRSVIVNALRKFESAGVIETRSLGMKGTRIKIVNPYLREQIAALEI